MRNACPRKNIVLSAARCTGRLKVEVPTRGYSSIRSIGCCSIFWRKNCARFGCPSSFWCGEQVLLATSGPGRVPMPQRRAQRYSVCKNSLEAVREGSASALRLRRPSWGRSVVVFAITNCRHYWASQFPLGPSVNFSLGRSSPELVLAADEIHASVHALLLRDHADAVRLNLTLTSQLASLIDKSTVPSRFLRPHEQGFPTP
jgi:hypothetical protein